MTGGRPAVRARGQRPEHWAGLSPARPAIVHGDRVVSYQEWNADADRLADALARRRLVPAVAAVSLPADPDWFVVNLALAKLGWRHVAVPPDLPPDQLRALLSGAGAAVLFADRSPDPAVLAGLSVLPVPRTAGPDPAEATLAGLVAAGTEVARHSRADPPLVLHTSGTTGARRPVSRDAGADAGAAEARRLWEYQRDVAEATPARLRNRTLLTAPMHHGTGPGFAQRALGLAGTVHLLHPFDPLAALRLIDQARITHWAATPLMLHRIRLLPRDVLASHDVSSVEAVTVGGAAVPAGLRRWCDGYFGPDRLYEFYGATEVGVVATLPPRVRAERPDSCGRPHLHVEVRVVAADGAPVPAGVEGELLIRTPLGGGEFHRVGDIGVLDGEGYLFVRGRTRDVIVRGGRRIHAAEVEHALSAHPAVVEAAVVGLPDGATVPDIVAFCEMAPGAAATPADLRSVLAGLDTAAHPERIELVEALPRNDVGKVVKGPLRRTPHRSPRPGAAVSTVDDGARRAAGSGWPALDGWAARDALDRAWALVRQEAAGDVVPEPERYRAVALDWPRLRDELRDDLRTGAYRPVPARVVAVPKGAGAHRPVPLLDPRDRVVYTALVRAVLPSLGPVLGGEVFGWSAGPDTSGGAQWLEFEQAARRLVRGRSARLWSTCADVAAFGQSVRVDVLRADLLGYGVAVDVADRLVALLTGIGGRQPGLPHDQWASAVLGGAYLAPGDAALRAAGVAFVRIVG